MKILITGGAGFIGSHLCDKYVGEGHTVVCLDNFDGGNELNIRHLLDCRNFSLINGDIRDRELIDKAMRDVEVVFHLAAQIHVDRGSAEERKTWQVNLMGTQNLLDLARRFHAVKKFIFASSSEVYGSAQYAPMDEKHPLEPDHIYGASKLAADTLCRIYSKTRGFDVRIVRSFNVFGPRQRDKFYGGVISVFTRKVLSNLPPSIYGDGKQTRDYTYIDDIVDAYDRVMRHSGPLPGPINFGTGYEVRINELARLIIVQRNKEIQPIHTDPRIGEVSRLVADSTKAKELLGWEPKVGLTEGIRKFISWYEKHGFDREILKAA